MDIHFSILNQRLCCRSAGVYVEGSRDYLKAVFCTSEDWGDCAITAFFRHTKQAGIVTCALTEDLQCKVPAQVIKTGDVKIWVRGDTSEQTIATNEVTLTIYGTGNVDIQAAGEILHTILLILLR